MEHNIEIIKGIKEKIIEMNKILVTNEEICLVTNKKKSLLNEMDKVYRCIRT